MKSYPTKGEVEDKITKAVTKFYTETLGVGPRESKTYIIEDMILVRLKGRLLPIELKLLELTNKKGVELVKNIRKALHEITTKRLNTIIKRITGYPAISSHSDISTKTGERVEIFILPIDFEKKIINNFLSKSQSEKRPALQ